MKMFEASYFQIQGDVRPVPKLGIGDLNRVRRGEYATLFRGEPCYAPVVGLTMITADKDHVSEILVAVRDEKNNLIHPSVVSTPTRRTSVENLIDIVSSSRLINQTPSQHLFEIDSLVGKPTGPNPDNNDRRIQMTIQNLLEAKLGLRPGNDRDKLLPFRAEAHSLTLGDSFAGVTDDGADIIEKVAMLSLLVMVEPSFQQLIPNQTADYSDIRWIKADQFRSMQDEKDLLSVYDRAAVDLCIHGVCIATSRTALDDMDAILRA